MITLQEIKQWMQGNMDGVPVSIGEITEGSGRQAAIENSVKLTHRRMNERIE